MFVHFNDTVIHCEFPNEMKKTDVTPVFKKDDPTKAKNYRPVSVLSFVSKVFERIMQKQISEYINQFLSPYLCSYRQGFSTQQALVSLIEKLKVILDKNGYAGAVLMDLSKAFDTIKHDPLIAKLNAYGFTKNSLRLIKSYLSHHWQRTKISANFSIWAKLLLGVPQGSVLGTLLFNIYFNDLFFLKDRSVPVHYRNIRSFATEIYKIKNNMLTSIMSELFEKRNLNYNLHSQTDFLLHSVNTVAYGFKSPKYFTRKVWSFVPFKIRNAISL